MEAFQLFSDIHLITVFIIFFLILLFIWIGRSKKFEKRIRWTLSFLLLFLELTGAIYFIKAGLWNWKWALPLQLCDLALFTCAFTLIRFNKRLWEITYFWSFGSLAAILTPDLPYSFPNPVYLVFFATHGAVLISVSYLAFGLELPLGKKAMKRVWVTTHLYALFIGCFNLIFGTNYLFLCYKPGGASPIDFLGAWPYYLIGLEILFSATLMIGKTLKKKFQS